MLPEILMNSNCSDIVKHLKTVKHMHCHLSQCKFSLQVENSEFLGLLNVAVYKNI